MHRSRAPSIAPGTFFVAQSWADCITNMPGFNLRQAATGIPGAGGGGMVGLEIVDAAEGVAGVVGGADIDDVVPVVPLVADMEVTATAGVPGVISPDGVAQVTTVPGVVGSEASGTGASVVSAAPGWVVAENGLGPVSGEDSTVPGVDGRPMAVLPMVETCARQAWAPNSRVAVVNSKCRIAIPSAATV
jgi:hypothetical protein